MERYAQLELPLLLPGVEAVQDACVARLIALLEERAGIERVHVMRVGEATGAAEEHATRGPAPMDAGEAELCLHYDPQRLTLSQVRALATAAGAQVTDRFAHVVIPFRDVGTEDDGQRIEAGLRGLAGVTAASVNLAAQVARVEYDRQRLDEATLIERFTDLGATPEPAPLATALGAAVPAPRGAEASAEHEVAEAEHAAGEPPARSWYTRNRELAWSLAAGVLLAAGWLLERASPASLLAARALYIAAYVFGARDNVGHFIKDLRRGHLHFNIDLLMVVAALGAAVLGQWVEGALLLFLFSLGHALEHYALGRARNAIKALGALVPQVATVLRDGREREVPVAEITAGDLVVVKPAARLPVDGTVANGSSSVNQAPITGESMPVSKVEGDGVFAGSVNGEGALVVRVTAAVGDRTLDRVIRLVAEAQTQKAPTQQFTDRFERIFVPTVLVADVLLIVVPPLLGIWAWPVAFYRAMTLLVAASPCALALGTPAAVLAGIAQAARHGVLIKGGAYLEALGRIRVLAVDKTGTITRGEPVVTDVVPLGDTSASELLAVTAAVEQRSQHPLARAILAAAQERALPLPAAGELQAITGRGLRATVDGDRVEVGRLLLFEEGAGEPPVPEAVRAVVDRLEEAGRTTVIVRRDRGGADAARSDDARSDGWLGVLGIADEPRPAARATVERLRAVGMRHIVMLTGDNARVGHAVASAVGIEDVRAGLLPEDKVAAVRELAARGPVAMVGDGVNDAPALAHATVGIAMGGAGTAAALETADVALMGDDLARLPFAIGLSRQARRVIVQNLVVSLGVIGVLIIVSVTGLVGIGFAVVVHEGSTLVVIANGLRLLGYRDADAPAPTAAGGSAGRSGRAGGVLAPFAVLVSMLLVTGCGRGERIDGRPASASVKALTSPDPEVRLEAARVVARNVDRSPAAVHVLLDALASETNDAAHSTAAEALTRLGAGGRVVIPRLIALLTDRHAVVRAQSAAALGRLGPSATDAVDPLATALRDPAPAVRVAAAEALARLGWYAKATGRALATNVTDSVPAVRLAAVRGLMAVQAEPDVAMPALLRALVDASEAVRLVADSAITVYGMSATAAVPALERALRDEHAETRAAAATALGAIGVRARAARSALRRLTADPDSATRAATTRALARIGPPLP